MVNFTVNAAISVIGSLEEDEVLNPVELIRSTSK
jgi:hypothetical protein